VIQILLNVCDNIQASSKSEADLLRKEITNFTKNKSRVTKGSKEARWNNKYMKIIESPVRQIEQATNLLDI